MASNNVIPIDRARLQAFNRMNPATQQVAQEIEQQLKRGVQSMVLVYYDVGTRIDWLYSQRDQFGPQAISAIAEYLNIDGGETTLYALRNFARSFSREFVQSYSERTMANGKYLTLTHWLKLSQVSGTKRQTQLLQRVLAHSLSSNELEQEIRALPEGDRKNKRSGGRNPAVPKSPMAGLQVFYSLAQRLANYEPLLESTVCPALENIEPDRVSEELVEKLEATQAKIQEAVLRSQSASQRMQTIIQRMRRVLQQRCPDSTPTAAAEPASDEEEPARPRRRRAAKATSARR
jgi:hypothetical protein